MDNTPIRFIHVNHEFSLTEEGKSVSSPAYTHAAVMCALMRIKNLCDEDVLAKVPGTESDLAAIVISQHEQYSKLLLVNTEEIKDEALFEERLVEIRTEHEENLNIEGPNQRVFPRYKTEMEMDFFVSGKTISARCTNASLDGACLTLSQETMLASGDDIELKMKGKSLELNLHGKVTWAFNVGGQTQLGILLRFNESTEMIPWIKIITALHLRQYPNQRI